MDIMMIVEVVNGLGTVLIAGAVAYIAYRQFHNQKTQNAFQNRMLEQDLRIKLLQQRASVIEDFRLVYDHYFREAGLDEDGVSKMISVSQRGALLFHDDISRKIEQLADKLLQHRIVSRRLAALLEHDPRGIYQAKVKEQSDLEDSILDSLDPLLKDLVSGAKVQLG